MKKTDEFGMRKYIRESLSRGYSLEDIETVLVKNRYSRKKAKAIIEDYQQYSGKGLVSNNILAAIIICFMLVSLLSNLVLILRLPKIESAPPKVTGMTFATGTATLCVNTAPIINISGCANLTNASREYYCLVTAIDTDGGTVFTYYDNTTMFNISVLTGVINFTPAITDVGEHDIDITVNDGSTCANGVDTRMLTLSITKPCNVKQPPVLNNLSSQYSIPRNILWSKLLNATDPDAEDGVSFAVAEVNNTAFASFGNALKLDAISGQLNITPTIIHIGSHLLNITATDNSSCPNNTASQIVEIIIDANNTAPDYIGNPGDLDYTWDEDTIVYNAYNLDDYFNDSDNDCLKFEIEYQSASPILSVSIDNNIDPRSQACPASHYVTLTPAANQFGEEIVCLYANDTINISRSVCAVYTVENVPEILSLPEQASTVAPRAGGGAAAPVVPRRCEEKWYCGRWSSCIDGFMSRNCTDINKCGTSRFKPNVTKSCDYIEHCNDGMQNFGEEGIDCGGPCDAECATCYDAIMNCHLISNGTEVCEEGIDCGGVCKPCSAEERIELPPELRLSPLRDYRIKYSLWLILLIIAIILTILYLWRKHYCRKHGKPFIPFLDKIKSIFKKPGKVTVQEKVPASIQSKINSLNKRLDKLNPNKALSELHSIIRSWLKEKFHIDYGITIEELHTGISDKRLLKKIDSQIKPLLRIIAEIQYTGKAITSRQLQKLIDKSVRIMNLQSQVEHVKLRQKSPVIEHILEGKKIMMIIFVFVLISLFFIFGPEITGMLIQTNRAPVTVNIAREFSEYSVYSLDIGRRFDSMKVSGEISSDAVIRMYIGNVGHNYLVFNSSGLLPKEAKPKIHTDQVKEFTDRKDIDVKLDYNSGTPFDIDDDGIAEKDDAVDLTVRNSGFSWKLNRDNLCTLWRISNYQGTEYSCYGSYACCSLLELTPERDSWDDTFYVTYGNFGATGYNIVSAQVIYANYSLDPETAHSEIIHGEMENISVEFDSGMIAFEDICIESCDIATAADDKLFIEIDKGKVFLEKAVYTLSTGRNMPPQFTAIPNITVTQDSQYTINLYDYVSDPDKDVLSFSYHEDSNLEININNGLVTITPKKGFSGKAYTFFTATDSEQLTTSNMVEIEVTPKPEMTVQGKARINEPVKWVKTVNGEDAPLNIITLEHAPVDITVSRVYAGTHSEVDIGKINIRQKEMTKELEDYLLERKLGKGSQLEESQQLEIIIEEPAEQLEIEYYTQPPVSIENNITDLRKEIIISSDIHYTDITAFTEIDEKPVQSIKLYRTTDGIREQVSFTPFDRNSNSLIDYIEWIVPHLSNQTYEVEITVLNVQSYPAVGGDWEVRFTTVGMANLSIQAINETTYGNSVPDDLVPKELRCGNTTLLYYWPEGNEVFYSNYECNSTGYWIVTVLTEGIHNQRFSFGDAEAFANNLASIKSGETNLTTWDTTDSIHRYATDNITFYANYTNNTYIANGTCSIMFNFTGLWQDEENMTYSDIYSPWTYNRTIPYKGTSYFNIKCENETMMTLNVTDTIYINNSAPVMNLTMGKLPAMNCYEDTPCSYNISAHVTEYDLNDVLTYDYTAGSVSALTSHADCSGCWNFDFDNGNLTVWVTTSDHANSGPWTPELTVTDSEDASDIGTVDLTVTAVNDLPAITQPASDSMDDATTQTLYEYHVTATDEEDPSLSDFNFTIFWCNRSYVEDCLGTSIWMNTTTGQFNFTPVNNDAGNYTLNISVTDSDNGTTWKLVNLTILDINNPPELDFVCNYTRGAVEDTHFNCTINATDPENNPLTFESNYSWFHLDTVSSTEVQANFTPSNQEVGNYTILINVTDGQYTDTAVIEFQVNNTNDPPWLYNLPHQTAIIGTEYSYYINAYDDDFWQPYTSFNANGENLTFDINSSWFGISKFNDTAAYINFTPIEAQKGNYTMTVNVTDLSISTSNTTFNLTIRNNTAPWLEWICNSSRIIQEEVLYSCHVNATDFEQDSFTFSSNTSWFVINATSGNATFTANDTEVGNHTINFTVTDSHGASGYTAVDFNVNNTPEAPEINISSFSAVEGYTHYYYLSRNVSDQDLRSLNGDQFNFSVNNTFSGRLVLNKTSGDINFTPTNADVGIHHLNITVNDSYGLTNSKTVNLTVINLDQPPVLTYWCQNNASAVEDIEYNCYVTATDPDIGDNLTFNASVIGEAEQWFTINASGFVNFTPRNRHVGNHTINISVTDSTNVTFELLNFTVNNTNDPPTLSSIGDLNATEDSLFNYTLTASDNDTLTPDNDTLIFASNSTLFTVDVYTGLINFTPNASHVGNYTIKFNVTDLNGSYDEEIINFTVNYFNDPPVIDTIPNFIVDEGYAFYYDINATDEEDASGLLRFRTNASADLFIINESTGVISFTPNSTFLGLHMINLTVNDTEGKETSQLFNLTVREVNFRPNITQILPYGTPVFYSTIFAFANRDLFPNNMTSITLSENSTVLFNHTSTDANNDTINSSWYFDNTLVYSTQENAYYFSIGFYDAGLHNITLIIDDGRSGNASFIWNTTINDTNRAPVFGLVEHDSYSDFSGGTENSTNLTTGGIILRSAAGSYSTYGEFVSPTIDMGPLVTSFYNPIGFTDISWSAGTPAGTGVAAQTRTSNNNIDWSNWSIVPLGRNYTNGEQIVSPNATYIQYKMVLTTTDTAATPNITSVRIQHIIPDLTLNQGSSIPNWLDLDDFFNDLDTDDILNFTVTGNSNLGISIDSITNLVTVTAPTSWYGTEVVYFTANDSEEVAVSNNITITISPVQAASSVTYIYVSRTRTVFKTRTRTVTEPRYLEVLAPEHVSAFDNETVVAPIVLSNNGEAILNDITLSADVNKDDVQIWFSNDNFEALVPGQTAKTYLYIKWKGMIDEFDIVVNASSRDPDYTDSAIISLTGVSRVESKTDLEEEHIEFVRDLLNNNPECLELTELLFEAEKSLDTGDSVKARNTLNFVIEGCRYLITAQKPLEQLTPIRQRGEDLYKLISGILLMLLVIAVIIILAVVNRDRRL